jgi:hypothetical protein
MATWEIRGMDELLEGKRYRPSSVPGHGGENLVLILFGTL